MAAMTPVRQPAGRYCPRGGSIGARDLSTIKPRNNTNFANLCLGREYNSRAGGIQAKGLIPLVPGYPARCPLNVGIPAVQPEAVTLLVNA